jgi:hypothetical protein
MRRSLAAFAAVLVVALMGAAPASAEFGLKGLGLGFSGLEAGEHPDEVTTALEMNTVVEEFEIKPGEFEEREFPDGQLKDLVVDMPAGFAGNPTAVEKCASADFFLKELINGQPACPNSAAVGYVAAKAEWAPIEPNAADAFFHFPLYNLPPDPGYAAKLGFYVLAVPVTIDVGVREEFPYNVYAHLTNTSEAALFYASEVTLWGKPADPSHDSLRGRCLESEKTSEIDEPISKGDDCPAGIDPAEEAAFLISPRGPCEAALDANFAAFAWNTGDTDTEATGAPPRTECDKLKFEAETDAVLTSTETESPTGLSFTLEIEDEELLDLEEDDEPPQSDVKKTEVVFPAGITLNPAQANGLDSCTEAQLAQETATSEFGAGCPAASKVGSVEVETPLLEDEVLEGSLFIATPYQNPFDSLVALYMVIQDRDLGISVKLPARVYTDEDNEGQVTTVFGDPSAEQPGYRNLPQLPLGEVRVNLPGGPRSPLVTPPRCDSYEIESIFTPWANPDEPFTTTTDVEVLSGPGGAPCPTSDPFGPGFRAGTLDNAAGAFSPFFLRLTRSDPEAPLTRLDTVLPNGLVGKVAGVAKCSDPAIAAAASRKGVEELALPSCPADSKVGQITAGAGVGPELTYVKGGSLYLAGPFGGAPLSVVAIVPAVAGPFDLGVVVTREALNLDPNTAQVKIDGSAADPIPTMLQGIPLSLRDLRIEVDRPNFTLNPTSCNPKQIDATFFSGGRSASASDRFQASGCKGLGFKPKLTLKLKGKTKRGGHPSVRSVLTPRAGDANIGGATVLLPRAMQIDNARINNPCTRVQFNAEACPKGSILGTAKAFTPLLDQPLEGNVYFRSNGGERELPDLVADLRGQFRIILVGFIDAKNARIRTRFLSVPDAPVSKFLLRLKGDKGGLLVNNRNICKGKQRAKLTLIGQNGRRQETNPVVQTSCKKKGKGGKGKGGKRR